MGRTLTTSERAPRGTWVLHVRPDSGVTEGGGTQGPGQGAERGKHIGKRDAGRMRGTFTPARLLVIEATAAEMTQGGFTGDKRLVQQ